MSITKDKMPEMSTDRELLELAAKAAGYRCYRTDDRGKFQVTQPWGAWEMWNPLNDDGDALRLAVRVRINFSDNALWLKHTDQAHFDPYAATRHVIVNAAAEIGKAMP